MRAPPVVSWLGYGGLLPFVALAAATWIDNNRSRLWEDALLTYGAVILSFVGALHWGIVMGQGDMRKHQQNFSFVWSVVPALLAWLALLTRYALTPQFACMLLIAGFLIHFWQDHRLAKSVHLPAWYLPLRLQLTLVACISLIVVVFNG